MVLVATKLRCYFISSLFLFSGCTDHNNVPKEAPLPQHNTSSVPKAALLAKTNKRQKPNVITATDQRSSIVIPHYWKSPNEVQNLNIDATLQIISTQSSAGFIVLTNNKIDFDNVTMEKLMDKDLSQLKQSMKKIKSLTGPIQFSINGLPALQYQAEFITTDDVKMQAILTGIEGKQSYFQTLFAVQLSDFEKEKQNFHSILNSFQQIIIPDNNTPEKSNTLPIEILTNTTK